MSNTNAKLWLLLGGAAALLAGCYVYPMPDKGVVDFITRDPKLEKFMLAGAQEWTNAGVYLAGLVTVNVKKKGVPIKWAKKEKLAKLCNSKKAGHGCTAYGTHKNFEAIYVAEGIDDNRLRLVLMHELIHVLLASNEHPIEPGIFNYNANSQVITQSDLDWICSRIDCMA